MSRFRYIGLVILLLTVVSSCKNDFEKSKCNYKQLHDNLVIDDNGNIFIETIAKKGKKDSVYVYIENVLTKGGDTIALKKYIDTCTFQKSGPIYFEDKKHLFYIDIPENGHPYLKEIAVNIKKSYTQINDILYFNPKTKHFYCVCDWSTENKGELKLGNHFDCIHFKSAYGKCFNDVDLKTLKDYGSFFVDKKYIYFVETPHAEELVVIAFPIDENTEGVYFENSTFYINKGKLKDFSMWQQVEFPRNVAVNMKKDVFHIFKENYKNRLSFNKVAVLNGRYISPRGWLDKIEDGDYIKKLNQYPYARPININKY